MESRQKNGASHGSEPQPSSGKHENSLNPQSCAYKKTTAIGNGYSNDGVVHARQMANRDVSPLTIPLNESIVRGNEEDDTSQYQRDPTAAAIASVTSAPQKAANNMNYVKSSAKQRLACTTGNVSSSSNNQSGNQNGNNSSSSSGSSSLNSGSGLLLKKLTNESESDNQRSSMPNISNTLEHIVQQLDILTQVTFFLFVP